MALSPSEQTRLERTMDAAIRQVQAGMQELDEETKEQLQALFESAAEAAAKAIRASAGPDGRVPPTNLPTVTAQIERAMAELRDRQMELIQLRIGAAAENGAQVIGILAGADGIPSSALDALPVQGVAAHEVLQQVMNATAEDGLNLSDRIWRNYQGARKQLLPAISRAVLEGQSAADAARNFVRGQGVPDEILNRILMARAGALVGNVNELLTSKEAQMYINAERVFRTEMDRANILAARAGIYETEGVVGTRFMLSPNHPRYDICDVHARANLYGLGPGVYPRGKSPLPAHPNTLSYEEAVFEWEVSKEDQAGRETLIGHLGKLSDDQLYMAMGQSWNKVRALRAGLLQENEVTMPWRELVAKYGPQLGVE